LLARNGKAPHDCTPATARINGQYAADLVSGFGESIHKHTAIKW
jgi:hypothetical protein